MNNKKIEVIQFNILEIPWLVSAMKIFTFIIFVEKHFPNITFCKQQNYM